MEGEYFTDFEENSVITLGAREASRLNYDTDLAL